MASSDLGHNLSRKPHIGLPKARLSPNTRKKKGEKRLWTPEEDSALSKLVEEYGALSKWTKIASTMGNRTGKQCRERYLNHLHPDLKKGNWEPEEDALLLQIHAEIGNRWCKYTEHFPGRTDCSIKNRYGVLARFAACFRHAIKAPDKSTVESAALRAFSAMPSTTGPNVIASDTQSTAQSPHGESVQMRTTLDNNDDKEIPNVVDSNSGPTPSKKHSKPQLFIEIPEAPKSLEYELTDVELLELCASPSTEEGGMTPPSQPPYTEQNIQAAGATYEAAPSLPPLGVDPLVGRSFVSSSSLELQFSPHASYPVRQRGAPLSLSNLVFANSPSDPSSISSTCWSTYSPQPGTMLIRTPVNPWVWDAMSSDLPKTKRQRLLHGVWLPAANRGPGGSSLARIAGGFPPDRL